MRAKPSFWEIQSWIKGIDLCVIGSGIVGLNAAIRARQKAPDARIVVLERGSLPLGASTRNAGFACFGSMTELLDDLKARPINEVMATVKKRWEGLRLMRTMLGDKAIGYQQFGSYELFTERDLSPFEAALDSIPGINEAIGEVLGEREVFALAEKDGKSLGLTGIPHLIYNRLEGQLDTGKMMRALLAKVRELDIEIWNGVEVVDFESNREAVVISTPSFDFSVSQMIVATNAFTAKLIPELDVRPSRNQVLITKPIPGLRLKGCFHYEKGYGYLRNVGNRVLIGGWRHLDPKGEETDVFGETELIQRELRRWLGTHVLKGQAFEIEHGWSGILGVGASKHPIVKRLGERVVVAVRLGGMGVAIGTSIGREVAELLFS